MFAAADKVKPPQARLEFQTSYGPVWLAQTAAEIPEALRESAFAGQCKDFRFHELVERTLHGQFRFQYLVLENTATGEATVQPCFFVEQDLAMGLPLPLRKALQQLRNVWPRLAMARALMVGSAASEGHLGLPGAWVAAALHEALDLYAPHAGASLILLKDFPAQYRERMVPFSSNGYRRVPSMPGARLELDFATFDEFLQNKLSRVYRKNLRRKFRAAHSGSPITMEVLVDATPVAQELHALYLQTHLRSELRFEQLTPEYFAQVGQAMPDRARFFIWRQDGRIIAFNLCMVHEETLYDLDVGMDYAVALDLHLYFVTWRDLIRWALENGLRYYQTGPLNYDPKLHLKLQLAPQDLYARHTSAWFNPIFKLALRYLEPTKHDPVLQRFENAHELQ